MYKDFEITPEEFVKKNNLDFMKGNIIKNICQHKHKCGLEHLNKVKKDLDILINLEKDNIEYKRRIDMKKETQDKVKELLENTGTSATLNDTKITFDYTNEDQLYLIIEILDILKKEI